MTSPGTSHHEAASSSSSNLKTTSASAAAAANLLPVAKIPERTAAISNTQGLTGVRDSQLLTGEESTPHVASPLPAPAAPPARRSLKRKQLSPAGAWLHSTLAHNILAQRVLLGVTLVMTSMVMADGVLTPSISGKCSSGSLLWCCVTELDSVKKSESASAVCRLQASPFGPMTPTASPSHDQCHRSFCATAACSVQFIK